MRRALSLATFATTLVLASPAGAIGWAVSIESPGLAVSGVVVVRARASGGVGEPTGAAYHARSSGAWSQGSAVGMGGSGSVWTSSWDTEGLPNGTYELEVRMWGDVPPYSPGEPRSYSTRTVVVGVENAPPAPTGLSAVLAAGEHRLSWAPIPTASRPDFRGYRVWRAGGPGCGAGLAGYTKVAVTANPSHRMSADPGAWCFVVTAERSSPLSGSVASVPSSPALVEASQGAGPGGAVPAPTPGDATRGSAGPSSGGSEAQPEETSSTPSPAGAASPSPSDRDTDEPPAAAGATPVPVVAGDVAAEAGATPRGSVGAQPTPIRFAAATTVACGMILVLLSLHLRAFLGRRRFP